MDVQLLSTCRYPLLVDLGVNPHIRHLCNWSNFKAHSKPLLTPHINIRNNVYVDDTFDRDWRYVLDIRELYSIAMVCKREDRSFGQGEKSLTGTSCRDSRTTNSAAKFHQERCACWETVDISSDLFCFVLFGRIVLVHWIDVEYDDMFFVAQFCDCNWVNCTFDLPRIRCQCNMTEGQEWNRSLPYHKKQNTALIVYI